MSRNNKVLILGSGQSIKQVKDYNYKDNNWIIIAVNNAWKFNPLIWDYSIVSGDFCGDPPKKSRQSQIIVETYLPALKKYGGNKKCGYSITLNAAYWALETLNPKVIGFLGCDMNYTPDELGNTHFYGVGYDISKKNISDPELMAKLNSNNGEDYIRNIYLRFQEIAKLQNISIINLSKNIKTYLPYKRYEIV